MKNVEMIVNAPKKLPPSLSSGNQGSYELSWSSCEFEGVVSVSSVVVNVVFWEQAPPQHTHTHQQPALYGGVGAS